MRTVGRKFNFSKETVKPETAAPSAGFACTVCGKVCKSKAGLAQHNKTHNKGGK